MGIHGDSWGFMGIHGDSWGFMGIHGELFRWSEGLLKHVEFFKSPVRHPHGDRANI
jgi:hypothetical protein